MCSRERRERDLQRQNIEDAKAKRDAVYEAVQHAADIEKQIEEGILMPDGTPAAAKRKRPTTSIGRALEAEEKHQKVKVPAEPGAAGAKRKSPDGGGSDEKKSADDKKADKPKKAKKAPGGAANNGPFEAGEIVEVSLKLGEAFASWYECRLVETAAKGAKWKVQLVRHPEEEEGDDYQPLLLQGVKEFENATMQMLRPLPPPAPDWRPTVGEMCEFFFEDGWWKVKVESGVAGEWTVLYPPAQAVHTVPLDHLRPQMNYDMEAQRFDALKPVAKK